MFKFFMFGDTSEETVWFQRLLLFSTTVGELQPGKFAVKLPGGETRLVSNTNGGPVHVDVKDGKIVRMLPIEFDDSDANSWTTNLCEIEIWDKRVAYQ